MAKATKKQVLGRVLSAILNDKNNIGEKEAITFKSNIGLVKDIPIELIAQILFNQDQTSKRFIKRC